MPENNSFTPTYSFNEAAKILDLSFGRNTLFRILREKGILGCGNIPYQQFFERGYFKLHIKVRQNQSGYSDTVPLVTDKGLDFIRKILSAISTSVTN
jgi:anti-repressor protein